jgi:Uma2 family endonuclease
MSTAVQPNDASPLIIHFGPMLKNVSSDEFFEFCRLNRNWRIERTSNGDIILMAPTGGETGSRNFQLTVSFGLWDKADGTGKGFDSSTGFVLPNGATRSPDLAWVKLSRWNALTEKEQKQFPPLCPDFVVELRSESDSLSELEAKMEEYLDNGAELGWLIDPIEKKVYIYRPGAPVECLDDPSIVSGDPLLAGFALNLRELW